MKTVNPPKGQKSEFVKLSITVSPDDYDTVMDEIKRRKRAKEPDPSISAIFREALAYYLRKKEKAKERTEGLRR
jgi:hypothetical protein